MACNRIAPQYENVEMGVGPMLIKKAIVKAFDACTDMEEVERLHKSYGDLGLVAEELHHRLHTTGNANTSSESNAQQLTLNDVYALVNRPISGKDRILKKFTQLKIY